MNNDLRGVYYIKNTENGTFQDITTLFDGVRVLQVSGVAAKGKAVNVSGLIATRKISLLPLTTESSSVKTWTSK